MATSEAQMRASRKYNENNYDRIYLTVKKGKKEEYKEIAEKQGKSLNEFINYCIEKETSE